MLSTREPFIPETNKNPRRADEMADSVSLARRPLWFTTPNSLFFSLSFTPCQNGQAAALPHDERKSLLNYDFQKGGAVGLSISRATPQLPAKVQALLNRNDISQQQHGPPVKGSEKGHRGTRERERKKKMERKKPRGINCFTDKKPALNYSSINIHACTQRLLCSQHARFRCVCSKPLDAAMKLDKVRG